MRHGLADGEIGDAGLDHRDAVVEIDLAHALELAESEQHAVGSGSFTNWLAENEKSAMYALARLPALHIVFWVVTLCVLGPRYFPSQTETILTMYFGYALPRFCVILVSGSLACYWCVRRNAATATTSFVDRVPATAEVQFAVRRQPCLAPASVA